MTRERLGGRGARAVMRWLPAAAAVVLLTGVGAPARAATPGAGVVEGIGRYLPALPCYPVTCRSTWNLDIVLSDPLVLTNCIVDVTAYGWENELSGAGAGTVSGCATGTASVARTLTFIGMTLYLRIGEADVTIFTTMSWTPTNFPITAAVVAGTAMR